MWVVKGEIEGWMWNEVGIVCCYVFNEVEKEGYFCGCNVIGVWFF